MNFKRILKSNRNDINVIPKLIIYFLMRIVYAPDDAGWCVWVSVVGIRMLRIVNGRVELYVAGSTVPSLGVIGWRELWSEMSSLSIICCENLIIPFNFEHTVNWAHTDTTSLSWCGCIHKLKTSLKCRMFWENTWKSESFRKTIKIQTKDNFLRPHQFHPAASSTNSNSKTCTLGIINNSGTTWLMLSCSSFCFFCYFDCYCNFVAFSVCCCDAGKLFNYFKWIYILFELSWAEKKWRNNIKILILLSLVEQIQQKYKRVMSQMYAYLCFQKENCGCRWNSIGCELFIALSSSSWSFYILGFCFSCETHDCQRNG